MIKSIQLTALALAFVLAILAPRTAAAYPPVGQDDHPASGLPAAATATPTLPYAYTVQPGDTLWDIAAAHGLTLAALLAANPAVDPALLQPGQSIFVPAAPAFVPRKPPALAPPVPAAAPKPPTSPAPLPSALAAWPGELLALMNAQRAAAGLPALIWSPELARAAQAHADDCARRNWISHVGSDGAVLRTRLVRIGYAAAWLGENSANARTVQQTFDMWWDEPPGADPHRANILQPQYREVGIGVAAGGWGYYFIADFGSR